jgi:hypothetical protein
LHFALIDKPYFKCLILQLIKTINGLAMTTLLIAIIAIALVIFFLISKNAQTSDEPENQFKAKRLLSDNELEFLNRLEQATPELRFHAQVAMGAIVDPNVSRRENGKLYMSLRGKFAQKIIDFVAQDKKSGEIVAIIELDDKTHDSDKDAKRDTMTGQAGYRTIRWHSKKKPELAEIRSALITTKEIGNVAQPIRK